MQVIRALYDYEAQSSQELSFSKGDFFHVIGRENNTDWYEACNPALPDARGLVPVNYFEPIGKTERSSGQSNISTASTKVIDHDSGYSETSSPGVGAPLLPQDRTSRTPKGTGAMVYGVVLYDFNAERPDELEAKQGEAIIVIAQSTPEWFVAKPIGRLGGPGLIPVSFIEIRDMVTGKAVEDPHEAVQRAGVPKVEEWKKMAADYKNSSIALGKFETSQAQQQAQGGLEQGMGRLSLRNSQGQSQPRSNYVSLLQQTSLVRCLVINLHNPASYLSAHRRGRTLSANPHPTPLRLPTLRPHLRLHPPLLLRRRQILVRDRMHARRRALLGTLSILRGLLRLPDRASH
jgi:bud emergence protein 1